MLSDTRRTRYDQEDFDSSCVKDNWRTHNSDKSTDDWTGKSIFRFKNRHQVAMSSHRKKLCSRYLLIGKSRQEHFKLKTIWLNISTSNSRRVNCIHLPVIARNQAGMDLVGCFVLIDVGDCAGIPCSFILGKHSNFKINQYAKKVLEHVHGSRVTSHATMPERLAISVTKLKFS